MLETSCLSTLSCAERIPTQRLLIPALLAWFDRDIMAWDHWQIKPDGYKQQPAHQVRFFRHVVRGIDLICGPQQPNMENCVNKRNKLPWIFSQWILSRGVTTLRLNKSTGQSNTSMWKLRPLRGGIRAGCSVHALEHLDMVKRGYGVKTDVFVTRSQAEKSVTWMA